MSLYGTTLGLRRSVYIPERHAEFETGSLMLHHRYAPRVTEDQSGS